jgi:hypothetical protein
MSQRVARFRHWTANLVLAVLAAVVVTPIASADEPKKADKKKPLEMAVFEKLLERYQDMTYDQLHAKLVTDRAYLDKLSFEPTSATYFDRVAKTMQLTKEELDIFRKNGFVSIDQKRRHSFGSAYYQLYAQDMPVLITSDSILHAMHRSYDDILMELELTYFTWTISEILDAAHTSLAEKAAKNSDATLAASYRDVDLYLTIARNLMTGAGAADKDPEAQVWMGPEQKDEWSGKLLVGSKLGNDAEALERLKDIRSLKIQVPFQTEPTKIYGGERFMDYSQFKPRGHYTKAAALKRYFRCMMWLGRVDCGWNVLPTDGTPGVKSDSDRELRDAVLLVELLQSTESLKPLKAIDDIINFMVGRSDNLTVFGLRDLLKASGVTTLADVGADAKLKGLKKGLMTSKQANQMIRSQAVISDPNDPYYKVPPPSTFQMFGQRYIIDSFVLSQVVFDSIIFEKKKQRRMMPAGLDVMAALGNNEAIPLLVGDLRKYNYSANLMACRDYVGLHTPEFWKSNLYNIWLDSLHTLDADMAQHKNFPEVMRTRAWQMKQLQTQLSSWAELRHDTILYAKQSYTAVPSCEYPAGYVEPYPEFYAKIKFFADEAGRLFKAADYSSKNEARAAQLQAIRKQQEAYFAKMSATLGTLETLAKKELNAEPFTDVEKTFIKKTIDRRGGGSGPPRYDGWYCDLFYSRTTCDKWDPTIADVHTDPESNSVLEVGVGDVNFGVFAINNEKDRAVYVGPLYSYYEFRQPVTDRLTDPQWHTMIAQGKTPARPGWVSIFQAPPAERAPLVQPKRE